MDLGGLSEEGVRSRLNPQKVLIPGGGLMKCWAGWVLLAGNWVAEINIFLSWVYNTVISSLFIDHFLSQSTKSLLIEVRHVTANIIEKIVVHDLRLLETINFDKSMKIDTHKYS